MDKQQLLGYFQDHYLSRQDVLFKLPLNISIESFWQDLVNQRKARATMLPLYSATGQPYWFVTTDKMVKASERLCEEAMKHDSFFDPFYGMPELLVVLANKAVPTFIYDGSLVIGNMMNAAADLGVASCWVHRAKEEFESEEGKTILKKLGIEGDFEGIGNLILGYSAKPAANAAPRKADYVYRV